ncbi:MAG: hypothetical protein OEW12_02740, partial [Deltaproteobacteria bacterium]|nr:hypothetical protein [Deltaproteobacteria bacterium]
MLEPPALAKGRGRVWFREEEAVFPRGLVWAGGIPEAMEMGSDGTKAVPGEIPPGGGNKVAGGAFAS